MEGKQDNKSPLVSIITVNYKQLSLTLQFLQSIHAITYPNYEIIVVDNDSKEDLSGIPSLYPSTKLIQSNSNLGFAGGNNLGIRHADGDYMMFLNNDTIVDKTFLEPLIACFLENPRTGLVSPMIRNYDNKNTIQFAGYTDLSSFSLRNSVIGFGEEDSGQYEERTLIAFAHGAAMMTSRDVLKNCGLMSDLFFLYYEEIDLGKRIRNQGYDIFFEPKSVVYHIGSVSTGLNSALKTYYLARNRIIYLKRHFTGWKYFAGLCYQILIALPKNLLTFLFRLEIKRAKSYINALLWNIRNPDRSELYKNPEL